jgi:RNA polymerase sigma factor (sigma-70 family)
MDTTIEILVKHAKEGDKDALEELIRRIQDRVYGLAIRMLYHPEDAEDAMQEILVKIITQLDSFREESAFTTWVYRIASNHLLTFQKHRTERSKITFTFENYERLVDRLEGIASTAPLQPEQRLIVEEVMISCMQGLLRCLDRDLRIAYILGEISKISSDKAAFILDITPTAFRKRLSRARTRLRNFMGKKCSLVNPENPCQCARHVTLAVETGWVDPEKPKFAGHLCYVRADMKAVNRLQIMDEIERMAVLFRSHPEYAAPVMFVEGLREMLDSGKFKMFGEWQ